VSCGSVWWGCGDWWTRGRSRTGGGQGGGGTGRLPVSHRRDWRGCFIREVLGALEGKANHREHRGKREHRKLARMTKPCRGARRAVLYAVKMVRGLISGGTMRSE